MHIANYQSLSLDRSAREDKDKESVLHISGIEDLEIVAT